MLSTRVRELKPAATLEMNSLRLKVEAQGRRVINFSVGEPDFDTPAFIRDAAVRALNNGWTRYTAVAGVLELRAAVAKTAGAARGMTIDPEHVIITNGAKHAIAEVLLSLVDRGDEVLLPAPYWVSYPDMISACEGHTIAVSVGIEDGFRVRPELLERVVTPRTVGLILNSPCNPTGVVYSRAEIDALLDFAAAHDLWVLSDEIYEHFCYTGSFATAYTPHTVDRTILISGLSKTYAMTGWRMGWAIASKSIIGAVNRLQSHTSSNASSVSQAAAIAALTLPDGGFLRDMIREFRERRDLAVKLLDGAPGIRMLAPEGAFYLFLDISELLKKSGRPSTPTEFCLAALDQAAVALVPGEGFGAPGAVRISFACAKPQIEEGLAALRRFVANY
ncbi:MAG: pyridoxal phosphate-dependent aminotransferase [Planctomycetota bacterium]